MSTPAACALASSAASDWRLASAWSICARSSLAARLGRRRLVRRLLDDDAAADRRGEEHDAEPGEQELEVLLALVVRQGVKVPLVLLARGHLGEARLGLGLGARALDGGFLHGRELRLALLLLEDAPLALVFLGAEARFFFLLPATDLVDAALLLGARALLGLDLFLLLAALRVSQDLLDGDHHRRFLPFRHGALFSVKATDLLPPSQTLATPRQARLSCALHADERQRAHYGNGVED